MSTSETEPATPTVIVTTHRHRRDLIATLDSLLADIPSEAEIVLVRSETHADAPLPEHLASWMEAHGSRVRLVCVPEAGATRARTAGMSLARADVSLFVDDDVRVRPGWFGAMRTATAAHRVGAAGGTIVPIWPAGTAPRWLPQKLRVYYGERVAGQTEHAPFAANLGLRRSAVSAAGGFRSDLGPRGRVAMIHGETELCRRLAAQGFAVVDVPEAVIDHVVRPDQLRVRWVLRRACYEGLSDAARDRPNVREGVARVAKLVGLTLAWPLSLVTPRSAVYVTARMLVNLAWLTAGLRLRRAQVTEVGPQRDV